MIFYDFSKANGLNAAGKAEGHPQLACVASIAPVAAFLQIRLEYFRRAMDVDGFPFSLYKLVLSARRQLAPLHLLAKRNPLDHRSPFGGETNCMIENGFWNILEGRWTLTVFRFPCTNSFCPQGAACPLASPRQAESA